jgi:hypothetical protein
VEVMSRTNRLYVLELSRDLVSWTEIAPVAPGVGVPLPLTDTNAPAGRAFYRVGIRRP